MPRMKYISEPTAPSRIKRNRRDKNACPFCSARIKRKTATSRMKSCEACKAQKDNASDLRCCKGANFWRKGTDFKCFTCGSDLLETDKVGKKVCIHRELIDRNRVSAIRSVKRLTCLGLKDSKARIEQVIDGHSIEVEATSIDAAKSLVRELIRFGYEAERV